LRLYKKVKSSKQDDLLIGINDMIDNDHQDTDTSDAWVNIANRGGLVHVHNSVHKFFVSVERVIQSFFSIRKASKLPANIKGSILDGILNDEKVCSSWSAIGTELNPEDCNMLLKMVANLFVTICSFSFAGAYIELYKQSTKKSLQR